MGTARVRGLGWTVAAALMVVGAGGRPAAAASGDGESQPLAAATDISSEGARERVPAMTGAPEPEHEQANPVQVVEPRPEAAVGAIPRLPLREHRVTTDSGFPASAL